MVCKVPDTAQAVRQEFASRIIAASKGRFAWGKEDMRAMVMSILAEYVKPAAAADDPNQYSIDDWLNAGLKETIISVTHH